MQVKGITPLRHAAKRRARQEFPHAKTKIAADSPPVFLRVCDAVVLSLSSPVESDQHCLRRVTCHNALIVSAAGGPKIKYFALQSNRHGRADARLSAGP